MRITEKMIHNSLISNLQKSKEKLVQNQKRVATNQNIERPSDDPVGFMKAMDYRRELSNLRQTLRNAKNASLTLAQMEANLESVGDMLLDAKNKASAMASDTASEDDRQAVLPEVELMIDDMLQKANAEFAGKYLFSGHKIFTQPYTRQAMTENSMVSIAGGGPVDLDYSLPADGDITINIYDETETLIRTIDVGAQVAGNYTYSWDGLDDSAAAAPDGDYNYQVSADFGDRIEYVGDEGLTQQKVELNASMVINIPGVDAFGTSTSGVFPALQEFRDALQANDQDGIRASIATLDTEINNIVEVRGQVGMRIKRTEASIDSLNLMEPMIADNLSGVEDVDMIVEAAEYLSNQETYQAALEGTSSVFRLPSLLDYIR